MSTMTFSPENYNIRHLKVLTAVTVGAFLTFAGVKIYDSERAYQARLDNIEEMEDAMRRDGFVDPFVDYTRRRAQVVIDGCTIVLDLKLEGGRKVTKTKYAPVKDVDYYLTIPVMGGPDIEVVSEDSTDITALAPLFCAEAPAAVN